MLDFDQNTKEETNNAGKAEVNDHFKKQRAECGNVRKFKNAQFCST